MSDIAGPVSEGNKGRPAWEAVTDGVDRLPIPGGWIYRTDRGVVFVPDKAQEISHMDTGAIGYRETPVLRWGRWGGRSLIPTPPQ